jgi:hypothetical protein
MMRRRRARAACLLAAVAVCSGCGERGTDRGRFDVLAVQHAGCEPRAFRLAVQRSGFRGGRYLVRTRVEVDGRTYMDERATIHVDGASDWMLYDDYSWPGEAIANPWPLPAGRPLRVELTLLRPSGGIVERQALVFDDCARGRLLLRSALHRDGFE